MVCFLYSIYETHHDILNSSLTIELVQNGKFHIFLSRNPSWYPNSSLIIELPFLQDASHMTACMEHVWRKVLEDQDANVGLELRAHSVIK
jgi:hypothetical protein